MLTFYKEQRYGLIKISNFYTDHCGKTFSLSLPQAKTK